GHHVPAGVLALVAEGAVGLEAESGETVDRALLDVDEVADDDESLRPLEALARRVRPHDRGPVLLAQAAAAGLWQAAVGVQAVDRLRSGEAPKPAVLADPERLDAVGLGDVEDAVAGQHAPRQPAERGDLHRGGRGERAVRPEAEAVDPLLAGGGRVEDRAGER